MRPVALAALLLILVLSAALLLALYGNKPGAAFLFAANRAKFGLVQGGASAGAAPCGIYVGAASPQAGPETPKALAWPDFTPHPPTVVKKCIAAVRGPGGITSRGFGPAGPDETARLAAAAGALTGQGLCPPDLAALLKLRTLELSHSARTGGVRAQRFGDRIRAAWRGGEPITEVALRFRVPPLAALKQALVEEGHSEGEVKRLLALPDGELAAHVAAASDADLGSRLHCMRAQADAAEFEAVLGRWLTARGVAFRTEAESRAAGPGALTPDILLSAPVTIRGRRVYWLDAKNYPGFDSPLTLKGLKRQAAKYIAAFGPGAFVFNGGVAAGSALEGPELLLLDGTQL